MQTTLIASTLSKPWFLARPTLSRLGSFVLGYSVLVGAAQIAIYLPFTPVPITGQTFGVTLIALLWGRKLGLGIVAAYLLSGFVGAPVFATPLGAIWGPTLGYLLGMFLSAFVVGSLADRGWSRSFGRALAAGFLGSICVYSMGLLVLQNFMPAHTLFAAGVLPFIPGDLVKTSLAAWIASRAAKAKQA